MIEDFEKYVDALKNFNDKLTSSFGGFSNAWKYYKETARIAEKRIIENLNNYVDPDEERARAIQDCCREIIRNIRSFQFSGPTIFMKINHIVNMTAIEVDWSKKYLTTEILREFQNQIDFLDNFQTEIAKIKKVSEPNFEKINLNYFKDQDSSLQIKLAKNTILINELSNLTINGINGSTKAIELWSQTINGFAEKNVEIHDTRILGQLKKILTDISSDEALNLIQLLVEHAAGEVFPPIRFNKYISSLISLLNKSQESYQEKGHLDEVFNFADNLKIAQKVIKLNLQLLEGIRFD